MNRVKIGNILDDVIEITYIANLLETEINHAAHGRKGVMRTQINGIKLLSEKIIKALEVLHEIR